MLSTIGSALARATGIVLQVEGLFNSEQGPQSFSKRCHCFSKASVSYGSLINSAERIMGGPHAIGWWYGVLQLVYCG